MKIGVISDSHDHLPNIRTAMEIFKREGVERILHCGDHVAPFTVPLYKAGLLSANLLVFG